MWFLDAKKRWSPLETVILFKGPKHKIFFSERLTLGSGKRKAVRTEVA